MKLFGTSTNTDTSFARIKVMSLLQQNVCKMQVIHRHAQGLKFNITWSKSWSQNKHAKQRPNWGFIRSNIFNSIKKLYYRKNKTQRLLSSMMSICFELKHRKRWSKSDNIIWIQTWRSEACSFPSRFEPRPSLQVSGVH